MYLQSQLDYGQQVHSKNHTKVEIIIYLDPNNQIISRVTQNTYNLFGSGQSHTEPVYSDYLSLEPILSNEPLEVPYSSNRHRITKLPHEVVLSYDFGELSWVS